MIVTTILLLLAVTMAASQQLEQRQQAWALTLDDAGAIVLGAWSPSGTCVAVATDATVHVIDRAGQSLWRWNFRETNRLIHVTGTLAVSPACDAVAVGGSSAYKYVWTADRRGKHAFFKTAGTPLAVKFSRSGDVLAVSTGARVGYLFSMQLDLRWSGKVGDLPVTWPSQVPEPPLASPAVFAREDIEQIFDVPWGGLGNRDSISEDGAWRVFFDYRFRGDLSAGTVELWGPGAQGFRSRFNGNASRQPRWRKPIGCPEATITRDGMFVVVYGDINHNDPDCNSANLATYVFDREGNTVLVLTSPVGLSGDGDGISQAVFARTGLRLTFPVRGENASTIVTKPSWDVPDLPEERTSASSSRRLSPDGRMLLITAGRDVRLFRAPD